MQIAPTDAPKSRFWNQKLWPPWWQLGPRSVNMFFPRPCRRLDRLAHLALPTFVRQDFPSSAYLPRLASTNFVWGSTRRYHVFARDCVSLYQVAMVHWRLGTLERWGRGTTAPWCHRFIMTWFHGPWCHGTAVSKYHGIMAP